MRISDPDRFQKVAAGVQAVVVAVAVVVGGAWTLYTFSSQLQVENARAQLQKLRREIEAEPKIEISLDSYQVSNVGTKYVLGGLVTLRNVGNVTAAVLLSEEPIVVYKVTFDAMGQESWELFRTAPVRVSENATVAALMLHAGSTNFAPFTVEVHKAGLYAVRFSAQRQADESALALRLGARPTGDLKDAGINWARHAYLLVK